MGSFARRGPSEDLVSTSRSSETTLKRTPLYDLHLSLGARMAPFAGYEMPIQYPSGIMAEHRHTRAAAGLFDVCHMGQALLHSDGDVAAALEKVVCGDLQGLGRGQMRYTLLLNDKGGILDDLMVTRPRDDDHQDRLYLVVNAACKVSDFVHIEARLDGLARLERGEDRALLALQGPKAAEMMARFCPEASELTFLHGAPLAFDGIACTITRSGYTGEDGFEISVVAGHVGAIAERLLDQPEVLPIGLGARDTLRLEAGLCLSGQDFDQSNTPVSASLAWTIAKRRREAADFPGADLILRQLAAGPLRRRVGIRPDGPAPARAGTEILDEGGAPIGRITSGGYGPTVAGPIAMGYVDAGATTPGTKVQLAVRGKQLPGAVVALPFVPTRYYRG